MIPVQIVVCFERTGLCFSRFCSFSTRPCFRVGDVIEEIVNGHPVSFGVREIVWWEPVTDGEKEINGVLSFICYYFMQGKIFHERMEYFSKEVTREKTKEELEQGGNWYKLDSLSPEQIDPRHRFDVLGIAVHDSDYTRQEIVASVCHQGREHRFATNIRFPEPLNLVPGFILFPAESFYPVSIDLLYSPTNVDVRWRSFFLPDQNDIKVVSMENGQFLIDREARPDRWIDLSQVGLR